jgi:mannonate dehydratase
MNRRDMLLALGMGTTTGVLQTAAQESLSAEKFRNSTRGLPSLTIRDVRCIRVHNLCVVKVETSEPGLYGLGCATFQQRPMAVETAVNEYLRPFAVGRSADNIEDMWQTAYTSSYWRNGPVLNNALSGLDQALWDIKGKRAGMPVYELLGGKCRFAVDTYQHCSADDLGELEERVQEAQTQGFRHVRIQFGGYGSPHLSQGADFKRAGFGLASDQHMDPGPYLRAVPRMFEHIRKTCGDEIALLHDIHERVPPLDAIRLIKDLEPYRPYFIEDPFAPEANGYFTMLRQQTSVPIAMGELFNSPHEWTGLITQRLIDFIRVHISQTGGLSVARKIAALAEWFEVRSAWHGPPDVSPPGHAANAHLDLAIHNFGIQEYVRISDELREIFPGTPTVENGYLLVNEAPGLGVDINEALAAKAGAWGTGEGLWLPLRRRDGTSVRP